MEICLGIFVFVLLVIGLYSMIGKLIRHSKEESARSATGGAGSTKSSDIPIAAFGYTVREWRQFFFQQIESQKTSRWQLESTGISIGKDLSVPEIPGGKICFYEDRIVLWNGRYHKSYIVRSRAPDPRYGIFLINREISDDLPLKYLNLEVEHRTWEGVEREIYSIPLPKSSEPEIKKIIHKLG